MDSTADRRERSNLDLLERDLYLKQLQINRLLEVTQAINNNLPAENLFKIYRSILSWELGIEKMIFYITREGVWYSVTSIGISQADTELDVSNELLEYKRMTNLIDNEHPFVSQFDIIIPVYHKNLPIAFTLLGDLEQDEEMYEKIRFTITITNIIAVAIENKRLFKRQIEQERLKKSMELARNVQKMLIPRTLPSNHLYELDSIYMPHAGVGGDYFDFIPFGDTEFAFCIGDISGKGVGAALLMANFQANLQNLVHQRLEKEDFIQQLNEKLLKITKGEKFITFFYADYCLQERKLTYVNAGHNPPILLMNGEAHELKKGCTILGMFPEIPFIEIGEVTIEGEAMIVTYTDGLTDLQNDKGAYFETDILEDFVSRNAHVSAKKLNAKLLAYMNVFKETQPFPDDISVLTCKILG